jgi:hypothetical protein
MARTRQTPPKRANDSRQGCVMSATTCSDHSLGASEIMKSPWWISVGLAALFAFATSTVLADKECDKKKKDQEQSELLADGKCDKECDKHKDGEEDEDEDSEESELLVA